MKNFELLEWTPEMVQTFWDYESQFPENFFAYRFGREIIEQLLPFLPSQGRVLDYGCGPGNLIARLLDTPLDLSTVENDIFLLGAEDDHIAPWASVYAGSQRFGSAPHFVLTNSGHIAGIVNPAISKACPHLPVRRSAQ